MFVDEITDILEGIKQGMQDRMQREGINASGRTSNSLTVDQYEDGIRLVAGSGAAPLFTLEVGRKAGAVPRGFAAIIDKWKHDKGLDELPTWGIITNIRKHGTLRNMPNGHKDVYTSEIESASSKIANVLWSAVAEQVTSYL